MFLIIFLLNLNKKVKFYDKAKYIELLKVFKSILEQRDSNKVTC